MQEYHAHGRKDAKGLRPGRLEVQEKVLCDLSFTLFLRNKLGLLQSDAYMRSVLTSRLSLKLLAKAKLKSRTNRPESLTKSKPEAWKSFLVVLPNQKCSFMPQILPWMLF